MASRPPSAAARAAAAARNGAADVAVVEQSGPWSVSMVHKLAAMVAELHTLPAYDGGAIAERVRAWYRFVDVVAAGHVAPDALPLASEVIRLGVRFLEAHPEQVLVGGAVWSVADVEAVATWYGGVDDRSAPDVVERVAAFAAVVRAGLVDDDAKALAEALFEVMHAPR